MTSDTATGTLTLTFVAPLPDDRYTLRISDSVVDPAGNSLDGENNAIQPLYDPEFPTGDGVPGGDFIGRFTVDTHAELAVWAAGSVYVDTNGNFLFDPEGADNDDTNEDIVYVLGYTSDNIFAGNFAALKDDDITPGVDERIADGFHKLGAYSYAGGEFYWMIDTDNNGVPNEVEPDKAKINGLPVAGNFDVSDPTDPTDPGLLNGDEVALKAGLTWHFDTNHDFQLDTQLVRLPRWRCQPTLLPQRLARSTRCRKPMAWETPIPLRRRLLIDRQHVTIRNSSPSTTLRTTRSKNCSTIWPKTSPASGGRSERHFGLN